MEQVAKYLFLCSLTNLTIYFISTKRQVLCLKKNMNKTFEKFIATKVLLPG
uniref:Uncharacterized protein n=1 Tax=Rhizophora mucronata TaxID=61149 RepID=A0A2P2Q1C2_RHIMU